MYKFLFELLTDPLSLPINQIWEYVILSIVGFVAFKIAWNESPGGPFGSLIHWTIRFFVFVLLWIVTEIIILVCQWLIENWVIAGCVIGGVVVVSIIFAFIRKMLYKKRGNEVKECEN